MLSSCFWWLLGKVIVCVCVCVCVYVLMAVYHWGETIAQLPWEMNSVVVGFLEMKESFIVT